MHHSEMSRELQPEGGTAARHRCRRIASVLMILLLPGLLGAWKVVSGETIDRRHVERIADGKTTKNEILRCSAIPRKSTAAPRASPTPTKTSRIHRPCPIDRRTARSHPNPISSSSFPMMIIRLKKPPLKTEGKILKSTLLIRFKPDGQTVMSHEYKEY